MLFFIVVIYYFDYNCFSSCFCRNIDRIFLFCLTSVPLQPASVWNPESSHLSQDFIDFDIPSLFGVIPDDIPPAFASTYDLSRSQMFAKEDWVPFAKKLQEAQQRGTGIVVTNTLTTVANEFYGIPAGKQVKVTWFYLGRLSVWESLLNEEIKVSRCSDTFKKFCCVVYRSGSDSVFYYYFWCFAFPIMVCLQQYVVPTEDSNNLGNLIQTGPFALFPNVRRKFI